MSKFGDDLIQSMTEVLAHFKGDGPAIFHAPTAPRAVREQAKLTQAQMAPADGDEPVRLLEVGTGPSPGQRTCGEAVG